MDKMVEKRIIVTSALPYANGPIHVGHLVEYIQTDIFVRFLKLIGKNAVYCCADDTHGTPIEVAAQKKGILPEELISKFHKEHVEDFSKFEINFDSYYSTNSKENKYFSELIFKKLKGKGYIYKKRIDSIYCEKCKRFLPDRYVKGQCPKCGADDQYGDVCEKCNATYSTTDLVEPYCSICGDPPVKKNSEHYFFSLSKFSDKLEKWLKENNKLQSEIRNYVLNWIKQGLNDWDISRDGPYFGFKIPGEDDKYFYVWLDAPIGYISSFAHYLKRDLKVVEKEWNNSKIIHFIGKDITYFHFLFWPAVLIGCDFKLPDYLVVHGFLTVDKEKMSKSRGTFYTAEEFVQMYNPLFLRFYYAKVLSKKMADIDLDFNDFEKSVNNELIGNLANFCYRILSFIEKNFDNRIGRVLKDEKVEKEILDNVKKIEKNYEDVNLNEALKYIMHISSLGNKYFQEYEPWKLIKEDKEKAHKIVGFCANIVKILSILIKPVLPSFSFALEEQLNLKDLKWKDVNFNLQNHCINNSKIIFQKVEVKKSKISGKVEKNEIEFGVDDKIKKLGINVIWARLDNIRIKKKHEGLEKLKSKVVEEVKNKDLSKNKNFIGYKDLYNKCNVKDVTNPIHYLLGLIKEKGKLPTINTLVDSYNVVAVKRILSIGSHDIKKIKGKVIFTLAKGNEKYIPLGEKDLIKVNKGEYICRDNEHIMCWLDVKQSVFTMVDNSTTGVLLYVQGNKDIDNGYLKKAMKEVCELIQKYCGGTYKIFDSKIISEEIFPLDLRAAKIISVEDHPNAERLYVIKIDLGREKRQIIASIKDNYSKEELIGKNLVIVTNLKKAKFRGAESNGMLLAVEEGKVCGLLTLEKCKPGDRVLFGNLKNSNEEISYDEFSKLKIIAKNWKVYFNDLALKCGKEEVKVEKLKEGKVC